MTGSAFGGAARGGMPPGGMETAKSAKLAPQARAPRRSLNLAYS